MNVDRRALFAALKELVRVADHKASLPILSHVLLVACDGSLTVTATDLSRTLTCRLPAEGDLVACLPAKMLLALTKPEGRRDAGDVTMEPDDTCCSVTVDGLASKVVAMSPDDYSDVSDKLDWSLLALWSTAALRDALLYVLPAASRDNGRPHLNCISVDVDKIVTTDGHRLHSAPAPGALAEPLLVSLDAATTLNRLLPLAEQVVIAKSDDKLRFAVGAYQLTCKAVEARFPPYTKVVPDRSSLTTNLRVDHGLFTKALARVGRLSKAAGVRLVVNGAIVMTTDDPEQGEATVEVPVVETNHSGADIELGFNPTYLRDAAGKTGDVFTLGLSGPRDAIRLDSGGKTAVVMPMRF